MNKTKLDKVLRKHLLWLNDAEGGVRADLQGANLQGADLQNANLRDANLQNADLQNADLQGANLQGADLQNADLRSANLLSANLGKANLQGADLQGANLQGADLQGADLDFSCFPLWCGGRNWIVDESLPLMLAAFIVSMKSDSNEVKEMQEAIKKYALKSHRAEEILNEDV